MPGGVEAYSPIVSVHEGSVFSMRNPSTVPAGRPAAPAAEGAADNKSSEKTITTVDSMANAGAGWYFDPDDEAIYRYWDGNAWTEHRSDTVLSEIPA